MNNGLEYTWDKTVDMEMEALQWCWPSRASQDGQFHPSSDTGSRLHVELHLGGIQNTRHMLFGLEPLLPDPLFYEEGLAEEISSLGTVHGTQKRLDVFNNGSCRAGSATTMTSLFVARQSFLHSFIAEAPDPLPLQLSLLCQHEQLHVLRLPHEDRCWEPGHEDGVEAMAFRVAPGSNPLKKVSK